MDMRHDTGRAPPGAGPFVAGGEGEGLDARLSGGPLAPEVAIDVAGDIFREVAEELHKLRIGIRRGEVEQADKTGKAVRDLRVATALVLEERTRVDKLRKDIAGDVGPGTLDLDAARDEIGRRLACLRRTGGG